MVNIIAAIPTAPLVDANGNVTPSWRAFFQILQDRTGGTVGQQTPDIAALEQAQADETTARRNADNALTDEVTAEANARIAADSTEASARIAADALLVPIAGLATQFAATDLSALPTTNPGGGLPWLSAGNVHVGP